MRKQQKKEKKKIILIIPIAIIILVIITLGINYYLYQNKLALEEEERINLIKSHYNNLAITNTQADLYILKENKFVKSGEIAKEVFLRLDETNSNFKEGYFKINNFEKDYYIYYTSVDKTEEEKTYNERYKKYIPFNKSIITNESFTLYDNGSNEKYKFNYSETFEIIINKKNNYGVIFDNQLLYIKDEDIKEIIDNKNTELTNTNSIAVLNYHFVYNSKVDTCNQSICHTEEQFRSHLDYISKNNIFTPTMKEFEMYLDRELQLPKSVSITIDDGWHSLESAALLNEYKLNGTVFMITSEYNPKTIESEYVEVHSHTHDMHTAGHCPGGQGGGIKCLSESYIQEDLKKSRAKLNNSTYFCYPFYEYNNYSIQQLKKAGFTMAFAGSGANGQYKAKPGIDKYQVPRYPLVNTTSVNRIKEIIG